MNNIPVKSIPTKNFHGEWLQVHFSAVRKTDNGKDDFKQEKFANENDSLDALFEYQKNKFKELYDNKISNLNSIAQIKYMVAKGDCMTGLLFNDIELPKFETNIFGAYEYICELHAKEIQQINGENYNVIYGSKDGKSGYYLSLYDFILIIDGYGRIKCRLLTQIINEHNEIKVKTQYMDNGVLIDGKEHNISDVVGRMIYVAC